MADQEALFGTRAPPRGRTRRGIDDEITAARANGDHLPGSKVALLRTLADRLDHLDRLCRASERAYDSVAMAQVSREYREAYAQVFAGSADPFARLLAALADGDDDDPADDRHGTRT